MKVLVLSATGCMGSGLVDALKDDPNHQLYAFTRNPDSDSAKPLKDAGITVFKGDFGDKESLEKAFAAGVDAVFFTIFPDLAGGDADIEQAQNIVDAAKRHGVRQLIYGSVARSGTQEKFDKTFNKLEDSSFLKVYWKKKWVIDDLVKNSGIAWTIFKPPHFIQNVVWPHYTAMMFPDLATTHVFKEALDPDLGQWWVDGSDTGRFAAEAIKNPEKYRNKDITFGTELLSTREIVEKLRVASGKDVKLYEWPAEEYEASKLHFFHSTRHFLTEVGYDPEGGKPEEYSEFKLTPISEWLEKNKAGTWLA
ncbi:hypothetical protein ABW20_dc0100323 [Dactylellina cionopaga]|nr:hypothetical protein ABW20_dc0100323 [Dactylellina cionopaga]